MDNNLLKSIKIKSDEDREKLNIKAYDLISQGVDVIDPKRLDIRGNLICEKNVKIDINVIIEGDVVLASGVSIGANCILKDCNIGKNTVIDSFSSIEDTVIGKKCSIGPYGRIRPGSCLGDSVQIGNFVEIKNAQIESECRINHHSFVGDSTLSRSVTIGAGTITCNHDGNGINRTTIGRNSFIGSNCSLVAPLKINGNSTIGAGSTITEEVPENGLTIARAKQVSIKNWKRQKN